MKAHYGGLHFMHPTACVPGAILEVSAASCLPVFCVRVPFKVLPEVLCIQKKRYFKAACEIERRVPACLASPCASERGLKQMSQTRGLHS